MNNYFSISIGKILIVGATFSGFLLACNTNPSQIPTLISFEKLTMEISPSVTPTIPIPIDKSKTKTSTESTPSNPSISPTTVNLQFDPVSNTTNQNWQPILYPVPFALNPHEHFLFVRPIAVNMSNWLETDYRYGYIFPGEDMVHTGIDISAPIGTPIFAAASGTVTWAGHNFVEKSGTFPDPYGLAVVIRHDFGFDGRRITTIYAHMSRVDVKVGQYVAEGEQIGVVGKTGFTTGPHLHFEIRLQSPGSFTSRNPELWIVPPEGYGVLVGRVMDSYSLFLSTKTVVVKSMDTSNTWTGFSYGPQTVRSDDYFGENFVLSDLPAGRYQITAYFNSKKYQQEVQIHPGMITFFSFNGTQGFGKALSLEGNQDWLIPLE
jgi:murein DD-endopeptidase MepM/ murein hydrolase activator NlpD